MQYTFTKSNLKAILKVVAWSMASAAFATLFTVWQEFDVPVQYAFLAPAINVFLYAGKEFFSKD